MEPTVSRCVIAPASGKTCDCRLCQAQELNTMTMTVHCRHRHWGRGQGKDPPCEQLLMGVGGSHLQVRGGSGDVAVIRSKTDPPCEQLLAGMGVVL
jgi:hypothetical protein